MQVSHSFTFLVLPTRRDTHFLSFIDGSISLLCRYEALEVRLENLRAENRQSRDLPPHLLQKHLDELAEKDQELETLKV